MKHEFLLRWIANYLFAGSLFALVMVIYVNPKLESTFRARFEESCKKDLALASHVVQNHNLGSASFNEVDHLADKIGAVLGVQTTLMSSDGQILGDSKTDLSDLIALENQLNQPAIIEAHAGRLGKAYRPDHTFELADVVSFNGNNDTLTGFVQLSIPTTDIDEALSEIHSILWLSGSVGLILILLSGYWISRSFSTRVAAMTQTINDLHSDVQNQMKDKKPQ